MLTEATRSRGRRLRPEGRRGCNARAAAAGPTRTRCCSWGLTRRYGAGAMSRAPRRGADQAGTRAREIGRTKARALRRPSFTRLPYPNAQGNRIWNFLDSLTESASTKCRLGVAKMRSWWPVEPPRSPRRQGPGGPTRYQPLPIPAFLGALASWRFTPGPRRKPQDDANSKCDCPGPPCLPG